MICISIIKEEPLALSQKMKNIEQNRPNLNSLTLHESICVIFKIVISVCL